MVIKSLQTDETVYAVNARTLMMPASNMKIVTLAAAADRLGWDYTYQTMLFANAPIEGGILQGDLVVVGSGDPSIGEAANPFDSWAEQLKSRGIRAVAGRIVGDDNAFDDDGLGFGWSWDDLPDDYAAGVSALQYNENAVRVSISPGPAVGDSARVEVNPPGSGLIIHTLVTTSGSDTPARVDTRRLPGSSQLDVRGSLPIGSMPIRRDVSVDNPTQFFVNALRTALIAHGIDVRGAAVDIDDLRSAPASAGQPLSTYRSPPLSTLAVQLMKVSQNLYAETLLKTLGGPKPATAASGHAAIQTILGAWGIEAQALIQRDASGLSRYDYVTSEAIVTILSHIDHDGRLKEPFEASLPIAGRDGTLANRMKGTPAEGNARAKTGSMSNVRALAGYVTGADGERLVFSIVANNFSGPADTITRAADAIVVRLAEFKR